jgi:hypothetical protein
MAGKHIVPLPSNNQSRKRLAAITATIEPHRWCAPIPTSEKSMVANLSTRGWVRCYAARKAPDVRNPLAEWVRRYAAEHGREVA